MIKPFDANHNGNINFSEIYGAIQYYHKNKVLSLNDLTKEDKEEIPDTNIEELRSFLNANVLGDLESFIS